jgi:hypothetical protein
MAEDLTQYSNDYMAEINRRKALNPNDPTISDLSTLRDQKLQGMYGNDFQAEINRRMTINPNDPMVNDLTRLRQNKIGSSPQVFNSLPANEQLQNYNLSPSNQRLEGILTKLEERLNTPFEYNPNKDTGLKQAQGEVMKTVREDMGNRGMLYSEGTKSMMTQEAAKLVPQYRQIAYGEYKDETARIMDFANFVSGIDSKNFEKLKTVVDNDYRERTFTYQKEQQTLENERAKINDAWSRVSYVGYVDNQVSQLLGLPVGTPSQRVREMLQQREYEIQDRERQIQVSFARDAQNFNQQVQLMQMKEQAEKEEEEASTNQVQEYFKWKNYYLGDEWGKSTKEAYNWVTTGASEVLSKRLGKNLYAQLVSDIEQKVNPKQQEKTKLKLDEIDNISFSIKDAQQKGTFIVQELKSAGYSDNVILSKLQENNLQFDPKTNTFTEVK